MYILIGAFPAWERDVTASASFCKSTTWGLHQLVHCIMSNHEFCCIAPDRYVPLIPLSALHAQVVVHSNTELAIQFEVRVR